MNLTFLLCCGFTLFLLSAMPVQCIDYIRAVSLGGHLVPEPFILPTFWETINAYCPNSRDIWNLCQCTSQNMESSKNIVPKMADHLQNFLDLTDLEQKIVKTNINVFRYPISFTYFLDASEDPDDYNKYTSCGLTGAGVGLLAFTKVLNFAKAHNVRVILDLHQVQGCQNGFDNGGHAGVREFFNAQNVQKGINIWKNIISYLKQANLLSLIWGFEILNEPLPNGATENQFLQQFTETVVNSVIAPAINPATQVIVLQPGPGNGLVSAHQGYNLDTKIQYVFDFHEYIVFGDPLYLTTMGSILNLVPPIASSSNGATRWPYFVGEWSLATTDCAQYLNGAFGGFDPDYYTKQHQSRNTFYCNNITQMRDGFLVGFQTCSAILETNDTPQWGHCDVGSNGDTFKQYRGALCKLFTTYLNAFKQNKLNVGFSFWTFTTGSGERRIQQWDYSWAVDHGIIADTINPTPVDMCDQVVI